MPNEDQKAAVAALGPRIDPGWADIDEFDIRAGNVPEGFVPTAEQLAAVAALGN